MSSPYPPQQPKRLERSKSNRVLGGVCAGVANYLNMDPTLVRVLTVVISLFTGVPVILYIIALFVVPEEGTQPVSPTYPPVAGPQGQAAGYPTAPPQTAQSAYAPPGASGPPQAAAQPTPPPASPEDSVWGTEGPPWEQRQTAPESAAEPRPEPIGPSEPEAPIAAHEEDATESVLEPEGPEARPAMTENPPAEPGAESAQPADGSAGGDSAQTSEGGQENDRA